MTGFLKLNISRSMRMFITRLLSLLPCILIVQFVNLEDANVILNIIQFIQLPFVIIPAMRFIFKPSLVDDQAFVGKKFYMLFGFSTLLIGINLYQLSDNTGEGNIKYVSYILILIYIYFLYYISTCELAEVPKQRDTKAEKSAKGDSFA